MLISVNLADKYYNLRVGVGPRKGGFCNVSVGVGFLEFCKPTRWLSIRSIYIRYDNNLYVR